MCARRGSAIDKSTRNVMGFTGSRFGRFVPWCEQGLPVRNGVMIARKGSLCVRLPCGTGVVDQKGTCKGTKKGKKERSGGGPD
jgi:hypothetical protein